MTTRFLGDWLQAGLLLIWFGLGLGLRFLNLDLKPLWTDEFATIVFSLGHSFRTIPLNQILTSDELLQPLQIAPFVGLGAVVEHLMAESTHPPLYFLIAHIWMRLFPSHEGWVTIWAVRSLPALLGAVSIPAMFGLGWLAFRSRLIAHLAALLMAVSPYAVYLAQEARHYTLVSLWVIASLSCWVLALQIGSKSQSLPLWLGGAWIAVNACGMATHYFFVLTLLSEAVVLLGFWLKSPTSSLKFWGRIGAIALGTAAGVLVWVPAWQSFYGNDLTTWIYAEGRSGFQWLDPLIQALAGWITMFVFLPIQAPIRWVAIASIAIMLVIIVWFVRVIYRGLQMQWSGSDQRVSLMTLSSFVSTAIALFFVIAYGLGTDITSAFRFNFVYFPAVVLLVAASLASFWKDAEGRSFASSKSFAPLAPQFWGGQEVKSPKSVELKLWWISQHKMLGEVKSIVHPSVYGLKWRSLKTLLPAGKAVVITVALVSLLSALTVAGGWGYQKTHRPELVVQDLQKAGAEPTLIAIAHSTHGQTGRLMGVAWELNRHPQSGSWANPWFLLAHQDENLLSAIQTLSAALQSIPRPLNLWLINFPKLDEIPEITTILNQQNCTVDPVQKHRVDGYRYQLHRCLPDKTMQFNPVN